MRSTHDVPADACKTNSARISGRGFSQCLLCPRPMLRNAGHNSTLLRRTVLTKSLFCVPILDKPTQVSASRKDDVSLCSVIRTKILLDTPRPEATSTQVLPPLNQASVMLVITGRTWLFSIGLSCRDRTRSTNRWNSGVFISVVSSCSCQQMTIGTIRVYGQSKMDHQI